MNKVNKNILFSIIVPVYNVEEYLNQCIDSILEQSFSNFELILVNDGSMDTSLAICSEYKSRDERIQLLDKQNGGAADSRNYGLSKARGQYVIFVDGDDFWSGDFVLNEMAILIKNNDFDIIIHEESRYFSTNNIKCKYNQNKLKHNSGNFEDDALDLVYYHLYASSPWDKIIKRSILIDNDLFFPLNLKYEDMEWCAKLMNHINTYCIYPKSFYMYRQLRVGSEVYSMNEQAVLDIHKSVKKGLIEIQNEKETLQLAMKNYWSFYYVVILMHFDKLSLNNKKVLIKELSSWKNLISSGRNITVDKVNSFYKILPFSVLPKFMSIYAKMNLFYKKTKL
ncbi:MULTISPECIES: glycosyltransferase family 2 protein [unclassified Flavobacterium]|jgi:glycosyltransferase involved in cell wall biosynthesis|uniref:glycosyltransferase family 2 protein n=1 Tax=unclassified Flavobacterium TaxID=196869 RepID=UPI000C19E460|nr:MULTISPECIES: glycosyltransferase family 2 protein [unclassified Flavobacterium]PIF61319.1 glycosyltransferase involved in cell wall biosynthesis [Flavobacterium sp. 11]WKL42450.1 glycosyltransferase family 2 protein [Flavobacterium sp. ZE23DGlu08]